MLSHLPNHSYGGGPHRYAYNVQDQTAQRVPSGVRFHLSQIDTGKEELEKLEKGINPFNIFLTFHNLNCRYLLNTGDCDGAARQARSQSHGRHMIAC
jgi:hypothetical protein